MPYLAAAVRAVALRDPARSQTQRSRSLREDEVYSQVFNPRWDLRVYLASLEITRAVEKTIHSRRTVIDTPPIALVHYIAFAYTCSQLGTASYAPEDVAPLAGSPPTAQAVHALVQDLERESRIFVGEGRVYRGIKLSKPFIDWYVKGKYPPRDAA